MLVSGSYQTLKLPFVSKTTATLELQTVFTTFKQAKNNNGFLKNSQAFGTHIHVKLNNRKRLENKQTSKYMYFIVSINILKLQT